MPRRRRSDPEQGNILQARVKTAPAVPEIRKAVTAWREERYPGATETSAKLLNHWFYNDHRWLSGRTFRYHDAQREAIETLIFLYEVAGVRTYRGLLERYVTNAPNDIHLLRYDDFARYAVKMATGSGKTKVVSLVVAWHYLNSVAEGSGDHARNFLVVAPNVIVYERLRSDFAGGRIFTADPVVPPEFDVYWDLTCYCRGEPERASSTGALYLTNIQQLYPVGEVNGADDEPAEMSAVLGPRPPAALDRPDRFDERLAEREGRLVVLNDEGHHTHDEGNTWNDVIRGLHGMVPGGVAAQLDISATPRLANGALFPWTVFDYPLKQAIIDQVVKRPMRGKVDGIGEQASDVASTRYRAYLVAGVERWKEYRTQLQPHDKKPVLFVMMNSTADADDVADFLRHAYPAEFGADGHGEAQLLVIHTDKSGEVSKKDLDAARTAARKVDENASPINAIVSVLMLREGWDVQNVTVVVGLRPFSSKANILPEQAIGRGLRLMFGGLNTSYVERVDIIGNKGFLAFIDQLERDEDIALDTTDLDKPLVITTVEVDQQKLHRDITIPVLSPLLRRSTSLGDQIAALDVNTLSCPTLPLSEDDEAARTFHFEGYDIITLRREVERDYTIPEPQTAEEVISHYAKSIAQDIKLPSQFAVLAPKVREFLRTKAFGKEVDLTQPAVIRAMASNVVHYVTVKAFATVLRRLVIDELTPSLDHAGRQLSTTPPFPWSRATFDSGKTLFTLATAENALEEEFGRFLHDASDVDRFAHLPPRGYFDFCIEYSDSVANIRNYWPDFVAVTTDGTHYLIETKGQENIDVAHKDRAAKIWCENATLLTGTAWRYVKVPQAGFGDLGPTRFAEVAVVFGDPDAQLDLAPPPDGSTT